MDRLKSKFVTPVLAVSLFAGGAAGAAVLASAQTAPTIGQGNVMFWHHDRPAVVGSVSAVNSNTLTVDGKDGTTYTVDVSSAKIHKTSEGSEPVDATVTDIKVGDMVAVQGTVSGTSVVATDVMDGMFFHVGIGGGRGMGTMGTVSNVDGNTITLLSKDGTTYTVDASNAAVTKISTIPVSDIKVGDEIGVHGEVSGNTVTAKHIMDGVPPKIELNIETQSQ
jgi:hypothetical protein